MFVDHFSSTESIFFFALYIYSFSRLCVLFIYVRRINEPMTADNTRMRRRHIHKDAKTEPRLEQPLTLTHNHAHTRNTHTQKNTRTQAAAAPETDIFVFFSIFLPLLLKSYEQGTPAIASYGIFTFC